MSSLNVAADTTLLNKSYSIDFYNLYFIRNIIHNHTNGQRNFLSCDINSHTSNNPDSIDFESNGTFLFLAR